MSQPRSSLVSSRSASIVENAHHRITQQDGPPYCPSEESDDNRGRVPQGSRHEHGDNQQHKQHGRHQHMEHSKQFSQSEAEEGHKQREAVKPFKRLSPWIKLCMGWSLLVIAGSVAFISWLWWSPSDDYRWRQWVLATNRLQLSVTITGFIVRAAVGALAASTTAMLASVAVEQSGVRAHAIAQVSMARFTAGGGFAPLFLLALRNSISGALVRLLLGCLVVTTVGLQLTSTLLVNDLGEMELVSNPRQIPNAYVVVGSPTSSDSPGAQSVRQSTGDLDRFWERRPRLAETFAEYAEPYRRLEADGLDDTGPVVRAFLPLALQEDRESVSRFQGMARVYESRVVCVRPFVSEMRLCQPQNDSYTGLCGVIQLDDSAAVAAIGEDAPGIKLSFACQIGSYYPRTNAWQLCRIEGNSSYGLGMSNIEWTLRNESSPNPFKRMWLLWKTDELTILGMLSRQVYSVVVLNSSTERDGPWINMTLGLRDKDGNIETANGFKFKMSLCTRPSFALDTVVEQLNITASRSSAARKKEPTYILDTENGAYDTTAVRRQLGAVKPLPEAHDRQVVTISPADFESSLREAHSSRYGRKYSPSYAENASTTTPNLSYFTESRTTITVDFCLLADCFLRGAGNVADMFYVQMLDDMIKETDSPSLALQAVWTALARAMYYEYISLYTPYNNETAIITYFAQTTVPVHRRGYWAVMALLAAFLAVFTVACFLFSSTQFSLPDNAWHTVAQISESAETSSILSRARVKSDDEVRALSKELQDDDEEDRFVVRREVFVRASTTGTAVSDDQEAPFLKARGRRRRQ
ncbi:hypothetical protein CMUS01_12364 [Colletotrichum musicola]|uniref:Uncharacterized protein n=1 Tax=Colletotrichum musicola TaxID=2175873 RepID=A0A8H6JND4_9PEZI|nr:hypothetical protein CMUS01_12364 [Colletotrichum musicola]